MSDSQSTPGESTALDPRLHSKKPRLHKVLLHNDNYTTMEFVVEVLASIFNRSTEDAVRIMLQVHHEGIGVAGVYPRAVAETKVAQVERRAQAAGFPLKCSSEPE